MEQVICQLRFPSILRIDTELPAAFQDLVRGDYPLLKEVRSGGLPPAVPAEVRAMFERATMGTVGTSYEFGSADESWSVTLNREYLALTTSQYRQWEQFRDRLLAVASALGQVYAPPFFTRIGLRYVNGIFPSLLGTETVEWGRLLQPHILGELANKAVAACAVQATRELVVTFQPEGLVRVRHGLGEKSETNQLGYVIDSDFFTEERTSLDGIGDKLDAFNGISGHLFRWCITERLHNALGPQPV